MESNRDNIASSRRAYHDAPVLLDVEDSIHSSNHDKVLQRGDSNSSTGTNTPPSYYPVYPERGPSLRGAFLTFFFAFGLFALSTGSAKYLFPRGTNGRQGEDATITNTNLVSGVTSVQVGVEQNYRVSSPPGRLPRLSSATKNVEIGFTGHTTNECTGNTDLPVLGGVDVVAYFSLEAGAAAMFGYETHQYHVGGYKFYFVSEENKKIFEEHPEKYMPAWGAFCSWGISNEDWWTKDSLGPDADPNSWLITSDGVLHVFRSHFPQSKFMGNIHRNVEKGNAVWTSWFEDEPPGANGSGAPVNTACLCNVEICLDDR